MAGNLVQSIWTVTFDLGGPNQRVLIAAGDLMEDEISLNAEQVTAPGQYAGAANARPMGRKGTARSLTLKVIKQHAGPAEARAFVFSSDLAVPTGITGKLRFAISGGDTYEMADTVFKSWGTQPRRPGVHETITTYQVTGGALTKL